MDFNPHARMMDLDAQFDRLDAQEIKRQELNTKDMEQIEYFGTSTNDHGHYFWILSGERIEKSKKWFKDIPFNPETLLPSEEKGTVKYFKSGDYSICAISGSCYDKRLGTKSVFWIRDNVENWKTKIESIPIAKKIINQMPFEIRWPH